MDARGEQRRIPRQPELGGGAARAIGGLVADPARRGGRAHRAAEREVLEKAHLAPAGELGLRRAGAVAGQRGDQRGEVRGMGGHDPYLREQRKNESVHIYIEGRVGKWFLPPLPPAGGGFYLASGLPLSVRYRPHFGVVQAVTSWM